MWMLEFETTALVGATRFGQISAAKVGKVQVVSGTYCLVLVFLPKRGLHACISAKQI